MVFDVGFAALLALALWRSARCRSALGAVGAALSLGWFLAVGALALRTDQASWGTAGVLGLAFVGPSALLQERAGFAGVVTHPLVVAIGLGAAATLAVISLARRARDLYPESPEARALVRAELAFVAIGCAAAIRAVTALLAAALFRDR